MNYKLKITLASLLTLASNNALAATKAVRAFNPSAARAVLHSAKFLPQYTAVTSLLQPSKAQLKTGSTSFLQRASFQFRNFSSTIAPTKKITTSYTWLLPSLCGIVASIIGTQLYKDRDHRKDVQCEKLSYEVTKDVLGHYGSSANINNGALMDQFKVYIADEKEPVCIIEFRQPKDFDPNLLFFNCKTGKTETTDDVYIGGERQSYAIARDDYNKIIIFWIKTNIEKRGKGYGKKALKMFEQYIKDTYPHINGLVLDSYESSAPFYKACGWTEFSDDEGDSEFVHPFRKSLL